MEKILDFRTVLNRYSKLTIKDKLHIFLRFKTCPWESILDNLPCADSIIDVGCGHGLFLNLLAMNDSKFTNLVGIDPSIDKINVAKQTENKRIQFYLTDIFDFRESADVYSIIDILYLLPYEIQDGTIKHIYNKLPTGGHLIIKEISKQPLWKYLILFLQENFMVKISKLTYGKGLYFRSEDNLENFLSSIGFTVKIKHLNKGYAYPHVLYICQK